jgi:exosome complex RNA-binding protein Rrp42 (RNase PH superfamily)
VNDDPFSHILLPHAPQLPLVISLCKIGVSGEWILDASSDEEECMSMRVALAVNPSGELCGMSKSGIGTINLQAIENIIAHATDMGVQLNHRLMQAIKADEKRSASTTTHK